jgi:hypothetical protein
MAGFDMPDHLLLRQVVASRMPRDAKSGGRSKEFAAQVASFRWSA